MKNRNYIGKAKEGNYGTLRVSIKMSDAEKFIREHKDEKYLNFYVSKMQEVDNFGNSHTAYCIEQQQETSAPAGAAESSQQPKARKKNKKAVTA